MITTIVITVVATLAACLLGFTAFCMLIGYIVRRRRLRSQLPSKAPLPPRVRPQPGDITTGIADATITRAKIEDFDPSRN